MIERYLEDLEQRLDPRVEEDLFEQWQVFAAGGLTEGLFSPKRPGPAPPSITWSHVLVNDALEDFEAMALQQLESCSKALAEGSGALPAVRCNYGTAILSSLFGAELFLMEKDLDTLPACRPLAGGAATIRRLLDRGVPDLSTGQGTIVFEMGHYYRELFADYPRVSKYVYIYHPDLQGPMNVCEMLWGGSLYVDLYDQPDLIKDFLSLITETYIRFMTRWDEFVARHSSLVTRTGAPVTDPFEGRRTSDERRGYAVHWSMLHRGSIMLRDDTATNLPPAMFDEFVRPYDQRLLDEFDGGGIHFCGRGDHFIDRVAQMSGVHAVNVTQPGLNNIEAIFVNTIDKQINLLGFERQAAEHALRQGRDLRGKVHCW